MCDFVSADRANWGLSAEAKFHIQKYDVLENIEKPKSRIAGNSEFKYRHNFRS